MNHIVSRLRKRRSRALAALAAVLLLLIVAVTVVVAQTGGGFDLSWWTIAGGGATSSSGGTFTLGGTIGQTDAGRAGGGPYTLNSGFWSSFAAPRHYAVYLPLIAQAQ